MRLGFFSLGANQGVTTCTWIMHKLFPDVMVIDGGLGRKLTNVIGVSESARGRRIAITSVKPCGRGEWTALRPELGNESAFIDIAPRVGATGKSLLGACNYIVIPYRVDKSGLDILKQTVRWWELQPTALRPDLLGIMPFRFMLDKLASKKCVDKALEFIDRFDVRHYGWIPESDCYPQGFALNKLNEGIDLKVFKNIGQLMSFVD
jgi:hypothetical protein